MAPDERPLAVPAHVVLLAGSPGALPDLPLEATDSLRVEGMSDPDGERIAALFDVVAEQYQLGERPFVWAVGEARSLLPLRRRIAGRIARTPGRVVRRASGPRPAAGHTRRPPGCSAVWVTTAGI